MVDLDEPNASDVIEGGRDLLIAEISACNSKFFPYSSRASICKAHIFSCACTESQIAHLSLGKILIDNH